MSTTLMAKIKAAMATAGHAVTEGEEWAARDFAEFKDFAHFTLGISEHAAQEVISFPATAKAHIGHFFTELKDEAEHVKAEAESLVEDKKPVMAAPAAVVSTPAPVAPPVAQVPTPAPAVVPTVVAAPAPAATAPQAPVASTPAPVATETKA